MPTLIDVMTLRAMTEADLPQIASWLTEPHVARWWLADQTAEQELAPYPARIRGAEPTSMLVALEQERPVGWCQWYRWADYPAAAAGVGARPDEGGIDYALGDPAAIGRGLGTELVAALVATVRAVLPGAGIVSDPAAANTTSRRVLVRNGFALVSERPVETEPGDAAMAIHRLAGTGPALRQATDADAGAVAALRAAWVSEWATDPVPADPGFPERIAAWLDAERSRRLTWLVEVGGRVVGMLNATVFRRMPKPNKVGVGTQWGYISNVYVHPDYRGLGLATELVDEALRYARAWGFARLVLSPSEQARAIYERAGFTPATELMSVDLAP